MSNLSSRNAQVEELITQIPFLNEEIKSLKGRNEALLILLGEKDEEVECIFSDLKEVKMLYRNQIEELLDKLTPPSH